MNLLTSRCWNWPRRLPDLSPPPAGKLVQQGRQESPLLAALLHFRDIAIQTQRSKGAPITSAFEAKADVPALPRECPEIAKRRH